MNIIALGESRFRILSLSYDRPYLVGHVEFYPLAPADPQALVQAARRLLPRVRRYMAILNQVGEVNLDSKGLPEEPLELAYLAAVLLQVPPDQKQALLDSSMAIDFLVVIEKMYRREVALLRAQLAYEQDKGVGSIPLN
jgi:Lon protease-like protein